MKAARNKNGELMLYPNSGSLTRNDELGQWEFYTFLSNIDPNNVEMYQGVVIDNNLLPDLKWEDEPIEVNLVISSIIDNLKDALCDYGMHNLDIERISKEIVSPNYVPKSDQIIFGYKK